MKVGIYSELYEGAGLGGREYIVAVLSEALTQQGYSVEFLHHLNDLTTEQFGEHFGIPQSIIHLRHIPTRPSLDFTSFFKRSKARRRWTRSLSEPYDLFVNIVHDAPARCFAPTGVLVILFPFFEPFRIWSGLKIPNYCRSYGWVLARYLMNRIRWRKVMSSYRLKTSISGYSRTWTKRRWRQESTVIFPPCDSSLRPGRKVNRIFSVGRFSGFREGGLSKRQLELMGTYVNLHRSGASGWRYHSIGGLGHWPQDLSYFQSVQHLARTCGEQAEVTANAPRELLKDLYETSKIFWHGAGFSDDESKKPELMEHFGIATVDAMSAGCVPIVIKKGAQPEIVEHGVSGFLWETLDELQSYTLQLINNVRLLDKMAQAAQIRAKLFSRETFIQRFRSLVNSAS